MSADNVIASVRENFDDLFELDIRIIPPRTTVGGEHNIIPVHNYIYETSTGVIEEEPECFFTAGC